MPRKTSDEARERLLSAVQLAMGRHIAMRTAMAQRTQKWNASLERTANSGQEFLKCLREIGADQQLLNAVAECAGKMLSPQDASPGTVATPEGRRNMAQSLSDSLRAIQDWRTKAGPKQLAPRVLLLLAAVERAQREPYICDVPHSHRDEIDRTFVRELAIAWSKATGKPAPITKPTDTKPDGGPFTRLVQIANQIVPETSRLSIQITDLVWRVAKEDRALMEKAVRQG